MKNEVTQSDLQNWLDNNDLNSMQSVFKFTIESLKIELASDRFRDGVQGDPNREILICSDATDYFTLGMPKGCTLTDGEFYITDERSFVRSVRSPQSKFGSYIRKYGTPVIGMEIEVQINEKGFITPVF